MSDPMMVLNAFFDAPDLPQDRVGGWLVRGHDKNDEYQEYTVVGSVWSNSMSPTGWIDWCRTPIEIGSPLLNERMP